MTISSKILANDCLKLPLEKPGKLGTVATTKRERTVPQNAPKSRRQRGQRARSKPDTRASGGKFSPLTNEQTSNLVDAAISILALTGMADASDSVVGKICARGGQLKDNRLLYPPELIRETLASLPTSLNLAARDPAQDVTLSGTRVFTGTGGAAPMVLDLETDAIRPSTLSDLYDAARLCDRLDHVQFFSRPVTARDMETSDALAINTAFACLAGTSKHVMVAAETGDQTRAIARICHLIAGSKERFADRPFLSLNVNHAVPPLRFSKEAVEVMTEAVDQGIPVHVNTFGQLGASSPVTIAGCAAQTLAETLAGMVYAYTLNPEAKLILGTRPMITDLRTGAMAGGSGEQALLTAVMCQISRNLNLPNSTIAGATDSKLPDAQSGFEKALNVTLAAHSGCQMITQAAGMQAGLMVFSPEACVIDNDMLGTIQRSLAEVIIDKSALALDSIDQTVRGEGHFLGEPETLARMQSDFLYPEVSDRQTPEDWQDKGGEDIRARAKEMARHLLNTHFPRHIAPDIEAAIRKEFHIHLPEIKGTAL